MNVWLLLICMGLVTYAIRLSMIMLIGRVNLPPIIQWALCLVPPAVLSAIIFPELLMPGGTLDLSFGNLRLLAGVLAAAVALLVTLLQYHLSWAVFFAGQDFMALFNNYFLCALAGSIAGALLLFLVVVISRGGMGMGDVKLAGLLGLMVGFPLIFVALFVSIWAGGLVAVALLISGRKKRKEMLPFGPFLCIGGLAALLWGRQILAWYIGLI